MLILKLSTKGTTQRRAKQEVIWGSLIWLKPELKQDVAEMRKGTEQTIWRELTTEDRQKTSEGKRWKAITCCWWSELFSSTIYIYTHKTQRTLQKPKTHPKPKHPAYITFVILLSSTFFFCISYYMCYRLHTVSVITNLSFYYLKVCSTRMWKRKDRG